MKHNIIDIIKEKSLAEENGVYYLTKPTEKDIAAEKQYLKTRLNENRIYGDSVVKILPSVIKNHVHYSEWKVRKSSAKKLFSYFSKDKSEKTILELGCGNGWLSSLLTNLKNSCVIGMDINHMELEQAARIFSRRDGFPNKDNLLFVYANIFDENVNNFKFDNIILASSLSYFDDIEKLLRQLNSMLNEKGEIHLIDNPTYKKSELDKAFQRSKYYYERILVPNMSKYYFHHDILEAVKNYNYELLYNPDSRINKARRKTLKDNSPFYWVKISR